MIVNNAMKLSESSRNKNTQYRTTTSSRERRSSTLVEILEKLTQRTTELPKFILVSAVAGLNILGGHSTSAEGASF